MKKVLGNQEGFTLIELMVVVAIIGVLSAVAIPNFKKYQAKAKQSEAKLQLASVYAGEVSALADYDTYATCISALGYERPPRGYYVVGFSAFAAGPNTQVRNRGGTGCVDAATFAITPGPVAANHLRADAGVVLPTETQLGGYSTAPTTIAFTAAAAGVIANQVANDYDIWTITATKALANPVQGF